jgi:hypothetical protein
MFPSYNWIKTFFRCHLVRATPFSCPARNLVSVFLLLRHSSGKNLNDLLPFCHFALVQFSVL